MWRNYSKIVTDLHCCELLTSLDRRTPTVVCHLAKDEAASRKPTRWCNFRVCAVGSYRDLVCCNRAETAGSDRAGPGSTSRGRRAQCRGQGRACCLLPARSGRNAAAQSRTCCLLPAGAAAMPPRRRGSCRAWLSHERALDQPGKQGGTEGDRLIIEVVAVVVHGCT